MQTAKEGEGRKTNGNNSHLGRSAPSLSLYLHSALCLRGSQLSEMGEEEEEEESEEWGWKPLWILIKFG